jgi:tetratricopeptide (TPR) repeat protein
MRRIAILSISLLAALAAFGQTPAPAGAPGASGAAKGPHPKSNAENSALVALLNAVNQEDKAARAAEKTAAADAVIKDADEFLKTYTDTDYKAVVLMHEAAAYHDKHDEPKAIVFGEQSLEADGKSYETLLLMAEIYSRSARSTDLDMDDKLTRADKYAKEALDVIPTAPKPNAEIADAEWAGAKQGEMQRAWVSLGYSALVRKKYDDATKDFQKGMELYPDPLEMLYIERAFATAKRYDDAVLWADKAAAAPNVPDQLKQIAAQDKAHDQALKKAQQQ